MMFFLYDTIKNNSALNFTANSTLVDTVKIAKGIFNHLNLLTEITNSQMIPTEWTENTLLDATFDGTINGGTISKFIGNIDYLEVQRKESGGNEWISLQKIYKEPKIALTYNISDNAGIYDIKVNIPTFGSEVNQVSGEYVFWYDTEHDLWLSETYGYIASNLTTYGITYSGTPNHEDTITVDYIYTQNVPTNFTMYDSYGKNNTIYTYQIIPVDKQGNQGVALQQEVLSLFNGAYIADANHIYKITYEYALGSMQKNQTNAVYTPYGAKYPTVVYNSINRYDSGGITAVLLAPTSESATSSYIDRMAQVNLVNEFNSWLANGKAKILKDFNGNLKVITVINPISNSYYKELGNGLASTSFNFVEVGEFSQNYLDKLGMTNKFDIKVKTE